MVPRSTETRLRERPLPWHRRLEARVAFGVTVLVTAALGAVIFATSRIVEGNALTTAQSDLDATRVAFYHLIDSRSRFAASQLRLVAELPVFRAYLQEPLLTSDRENISKMADDYRRSMGADFVVVTNAAARWLVSPGWDSDTAAPPERMLAGIEGARSGIASSAIVAHRNQLFLSVSQPALFADEVLATIRAGFRLDDVVARELALSARCDVNLLSGNRLFGSSLRPADQQTVRDLLARDARALGTLGEPVTLRSVGEAKYIGGAFPMSPEASDTSSATLVLLQDWEPTQQSIEQVTSRVLQVGGVVFLVALGCGFLVSRRITRPLRDIARVTGDVAAGRWDRQVPVRGTDETAALALAFNDMTTSLSHWHAEAQSKTAELQDSYERFFAVTHSASDAIVSTDSQGLILSWNLSAMRMFGFTEAEAVGTPFEEMLDPASRPAYQDHTARVRQNPFGDQALEGLGSHKSGATLPLELSLASWMSGGGVNFSVIARDVSKRKQAEAELRSRELELQQAQKMEAVGQLAGGVAHDFNNLLTAIRGYAELLVGDLAAQDPRRDDAEQIVKAADSASSLTKQLLAFSRKQILSPTLVSLSDILRSMTKMLGRLIGENVDLSVEFDPDLWTVKADAGQIEQVVMNLVVNARDAMPTGGRIVVRAENVAAASPADRGPVTDSVALTVRDTGVGMGPETVARIFEPFFTTKGEGRGTGLGLAMVDGIIEQSGGSLSVESALGRGTCFRVLLPRVEGAPIAPDTVSLAEPRRAGETVLLVEDEAAVRRFARLALMREGYTVIEAARGDDALAGAARHDGPIHLLLSDVVMPGMNGRELWERLTGVRREAKVLFMSGYTDDAVFRLGISDLGLPYLQKPFTVQSLAAAVSGALAGGQAVAPS